MWLLAIVSVGGGNTRAEIERLRSPIEAVEQAFRMDKL
jgi:hypothetical protein